MVKSELDQLKEKLTHFDKETSTYLNEIKHLIPLKASKAAPSLIGYFTHSTNVTNNLSDLNFILGHLHILNSGSTPLHQLTICLDINLSCPYNFSGKYILENNQPSLSMSYFWEFIEQTDHQHWFKLIKKETLEPSEAVSFSDFTIKWQPKESYTCAVRGFIYCEEIKEGLSTINSISLSGKLS